MEASYLPTTDQTALPPAARVLVISAVKPVAQLDGDEVRHTSPPQPVLAAGLYRFGRGPKPDLLLCIAGTPPVAVVAVDDIADSVALSSAREWFDLLWASAEPLAGMAAFAAGDRVMLANDERVWVVEDVSPADDSYRYNLSSGSQRAVSVREQSILRGAPSVGTSEDWIRQQPVNAAKSSISITLTKLLHPLTDVVYSHLASRTVFRAYQFRPVLKLVNSSRSGLLIADEVGLGKTIEAGLVWIELDARAGADLERVLVVCPAALVDKWRAEMSERFGRQLEVLDAEALRELRSKAEHGQPDSPLHAVASVEGLRRSEDLMRMVEIGSRFDLVILDEAHVVRNAGTKSHRLGQMLERMAHWLVLLSATPLNLGQRDLFNLVELIDPATFEASELFPNQLEPNAALNAALSRLFDLRHDPRALLVLLRRVEEVDFGAGVARRPEYSDLCGLLDRPSPLTDTEVAHCVRLFGELNVLSSVVTRTRKVDVPEDKVVREPIDVQVPVTEPETVAYEAIRRWAHARAVELDHPPGLVCQMPLRQAASCLQVFARGDWRSLGAEAELLRASSLDGADLFDELDESVLELRAEEMPAGDEWIEVLDALRNLGQTDSKYDALESILGDARVRGRPVLLFSFFKGTLRYLEERLATRWRVKRIDGDVAQADRQQAMTDFRAGRYDVLLASEVASEGLDFEFAGVLVNYDLPWNPMRVEQRIGRLDRFGQLYEKILIINFHQPGTIETEIFSRLYDRIALFRSSVGELEQILADSPRQMMEIAFDLDLSSVERQRRTDEMAAAIEAKRRDLATLDETGQIAALDKLLVEGLERAVNERGRFIGNRELVPLLRHFMSDGAEGQVHVHSTDEIHVVGDKEIARRLTRAGVKGRPGLLQGIRDGDTMPLALSNDDRRASVDLLSHRHPLIRAAVEHYRDRQPDRFGEVAIEGAVDQVLLVLLWMVEMRGARNELELWTSAVSLGSGEVVPGAGDALLQAVAMDRLIDPPEPYTGSGLDRALQIARSDLEHRQSLEEVDRRLRNEQTVDAFIANERATVAAKVRKLRKQLEVPDADRRIRSMRAAQIRNLESATDERVADLEARRGLSLIPAEVGVFLVHRMSHQGRRGSR